MFMPRASFPMPPLRRSPMSLLILSHTVFGIAALAAGAFVLARQKGDRWHRWTGWGYTASLAVLCVESFWIQDATPFFRGFGMFHVMALVSLGTLLAGIIPAIRRRPGWLGWHYAFMAWSYIGLVMATGSHVFRPVFLFFLRDVGLPAAVCGVATALVLWGLPPLVGALLIKRREPGWQRLAAEDTA